MKKILEFFKNKYVISLIGLIALSILIWFIGPLVKFGEDNSAPLESSTVRLIIILVIVVLWGLNNLRIQMTTRKNNNELVSDLQDSQGAAQQDAASEQSQDELRQINERFTQALSTLKKLKFSGRGSSKALYQLPWYIIIGPPGSGKTTALINSTLDFPLAEHIGKGSLQGVGGTRNCDWWFTNDAVLVDTAGRYTTQDSHRVHDSSAWNGFLNLLKKNRKRRPINGAIIAISVQDLLVQTEDERIMHAKTIRSRIDELMEKLEIRFPIYLMFTKTDLISGFSEFFEDLSKDDREQVWGISLPNAPKQSQSPDFDYLSAEYDNLISRIYERVLWRVHQERDVHRRGFIQGFPQQMENLKTVIDSFVRQTFVKNRFQYQPYLRGIYFTSGTQDGTPIDRLMTSVAAGFGFAREMIHASGQQGKSFFLGRLFREVIFPESELVGANRKYELIIKWAKNASYAGMLGLCLLLIVVWAGSFTQHEMFMSEVKTYVAEFDAENKRLTAWNKDIVAALPTLNALGKASIVYDQEAHPWLTGMGLYDGNVDAAADKAYREQLVTLLLPRLISYLEVYLKQGHEGGDLYNTFRTYLMFNKVEHKDTKLIVDWFQTNWSRQLQGEATRRKELEMHLKALLEIDFAPVELNDNLVGQVRSVLLRVPVAQRIYGRVRTNPELIHNIDMLNQFGESVRAAYKIDGKTTRALSVPLLFTIEGYNNIDLSTSSPIIADIVNERWVLSDDTEARVDFVKDDLDEISSQVKDHYLADYTKVWSDVFNSLEIAEFRDLKQAFDVLTSFTDPVYSPLVSILQVGKMNTQLTPPVMSNLADDVSEGAAGKATSYLASKFNGTTVDRQFIELHKLLRETEKNPAKINNILLQIQQLQDFVGEISVAPDPTKKAFEVAKARYQSGSGNALTSLTTFAKTMPAPVNTWLDSLASETWKVILRSAHQHVNAEWRTQVYEPYRQGLSGRYPVSSQAREELALFDFTEFFKPAGAVDKFYTEYMKPFITPGDGWGNRAIDNYSIGFSSAGLAQVRKAQAIKNIFYTENPAVPTLSFELKPSRFDKNDAVFTLEIGDERVSYNHGPKFWKAVKWSGGDENKRVRIIFEDVAGNQHKKSYEGPWAWFRLQDDSRLLKTSKSNVYQVTYEVKADGSASSSDVHSIEYEIKAKSVNNPFSKNFIGSFQCPDSI